MLTDAEVDDLARDIITQSIAYIIDLGNPPFAAVRKTKAGDPLIVYSASAEGHGEFTFEYAPLEIAKKIIRVCERYYDTFKINTTDPKSGESITLPLAPISRDQQVGNMAFNATAHLIITCRTELWQTIEESLEDSKLIAAAVLASTVGKTLSMRSGEATSDARDAINKAAERVAEKKRSKLRIFMNELPNLVVQRGPGAPPKPKTQKKQERDEYKANVETAYRKVRLETGKKPKKVWVARELGEGGFSPKTGNDTSLQSFNRKLERLELDYNSIVENVEPEPKQ